MHSIAYLIGRLLLPIIFLVSGVQKALNVNGIASSLASEVPIPAQVEAYLGGLSRYVVAGYGVAAVEIIGGLMVLVGLKARWGAAALALLTLGTIVLIHNFWTMSGEAATVNQVQALKNLSILGGLLLVVAGGSRGREGYR